MIFYARVLSGAQGALGFLVIVHLLGVGFWDHLKCKCLTNDLQTISLHLIQIVGSHVGCIQNIAKVRNCPDITILNSHFIHSHIHGLGLHLEISHGVGHRVGYVLVMAHGVSHFQS